MDIGATSLDDFSTADPHNGSNKQTTSENQPVNGIFEEEFQIGGTRTVGAGIADTWVVNPLYSESEVQRVFNRAQGDE